MSTSGGGFAGSINGGEIIDCYSTGAVTGSEEAYLGGFCGGNWGDIDECFWDTETSGLDTSDGGTGMTTLEMKDWETFSDAHWDIYLDDNDRIWARSDVCNNGYPCLVNVTPSCEWITILVETDAATGILAHGATLNGELTSMGPLLLVDVYFEYGLISGGPYIYTTPIQVMLATGIFSAAVAHLLALTSYYFRAVADDGSNVAYGIERTFTTIGPTALNTAMILASQNDPKLNSLKLDQKSFLMKLHDRSATLKVNRAE